MWRSKRFVIIALLAIVVVAGSIGGVVLAQTEGEEDIPPAPRYEALLEKVCEIYNEANPEAPIDSEALKDAFVQAGNQLGAEVRQNFRQRLIDEGKITQEQLDQFDAWLESKPDVPFPFGPDGREGMKPFGGGRHGFGMFGGRFHGPFGPPCAPQEEPA